MNSSSYVPDILLLKDCVISDCSYIRNGGHSTILVGSMHSIGYKSYNVAVKRLCNKTYTREAHNELHFASMNIKHPNIIQIIQFEQTLEYSFICMKLYTKTFADLIYTNYNIINKDKDKYVQQLTDAVGHLHAHQFVHRDIKPQNIMLTDTHNLVLIDFSLSGPVTLGTKESFAPHAKWYRAPEYFFNLHNDPYKADIWAVGMVLIELDTRKPILSDANESDYKMFLENLLFPIQLNDFSNSNKLVYQRLVKGKGSLSHNIMNSLLSINPSLRHLY